MAARPVRRRVMATIQERGGITALLTRFADGTPLAELARELDCSRQFLHFELNKPKFRDVYLEAKKMAAEAIADRMDDIASKVPANRDAAARDRLKLEHWRWRCQVLDREQFGDKAVQINVTTVGQLHLQALMAQPKPVLGVPQSPALPAGSDDGEAKDGAVDQP